MDHVDIPVTRYSGDPTGTLAFYSLVNKTTIVGGPLADTQKSCKSSAYRGKEQTIQHFFTLLTKK
ncbi:hypothetical protein [Spirosoma fluviale]|uniref:Uncharacterized protein n=1 Tax=Spirosoma fluviale TaxID=1597977 RepID=A0A286FZT1_9BACT|nr:hypothetical protein [Spirosoma fluviale]SOD88718.1 hypothetical protein SAMN06269250_2808 [Spirosoma fluviale]